MAKTLAWTVLGVDKASPALQKVAKSADNTADRLTALGKQGAKATEEMSEAAQRAADRVTKAQRAQEDQIGRLRVAQSKLAELSDDAKGSQRAAAEESVAAALRRVETAQESVAAAQRKLRAEMSKPIEVPVKVDDDSVGKELRKAGAGGADDFSDGFLGALKGSGLVAGIGAMVTSALDSLAESKNFLGSIQNQMGISAAEAQDFGNRIGEAYADGLGDSKEQIASVYSTLSSDVKNWARLTKNQQDEVARNQTKIVQGFGLDVGQSIAAASSAVQNKLVPTWKDAQDLIVKGYQTLGSRGDDWAETLQEYSGYFTQLGITGPQALGLIQQGLEAGARDTDYVADLWKEVGIRIIDTADSTKDALKDLFKGTKTNVEQLQKTIAAGGPPAEAALSKVITKLQGIKDPVEKNRLGVALFGTQYEDTFRRVIEQTDLAKAKLTDYKGATDSLVANTRTLTERLGAMWDSFNVRTGKAIDDLKGRIGTGDWLGPPKANLDLFAGSMGEATDAANTYGISLDGTNRGISELAESVGGVTSAQFPELIRKMSDSQLAALGVTTTLDGLGNRVLTLPDGHKITINTNTGQVSGDLDALKRKVNSLPDKGFFTYYINTVVSGPGTGSLNSLTGALRGYAEGTDFAPGGLAVVGEKGPEIVSLPRGSKVYTSSESEQLAARWAGGGMSAIGGMAGSAAPPNVYVSVDFGGVSNNALVAALREAVKIRGGNVQKVLGQ